MEKIGRFPLCGCHWIKETTQRIGGTSNTITKWEQQTFEWDKITQKSINWRVECITKITIRISWIEFTSTGTNQSTYIGYAIFEDLIVNQDRRLWELEKKILTIGVIESWFKGNWREVCICQFTINTN